jgi:RNA polymerase sigma factor (sigma-70 family)
MAAWTIRELTSYQVQRMPTLPFEPELCVKVNEGNESALGKLIEMYHEAAASFIAGWWFNHPLIREPLDEARDAVQNAATRLSKRCPKLNPQLGFGSLFYACARNAARDILRNKRREFQGLSSLPQRAFETIRDANDAEFNLAVKKWNEILDDLDIDEKQLIELVLEHAVPLEEAVTTIGIDRATGYRWIDKAKAKLTNALWPED